MLLVNIATLTVAVLLCLWTALFDPFSPEPLYYRILVALVAVRLAWIVRKLAGYYRQDFGRAVST